MEKQQARAAVVSDDSDTGQDDRGDFSEYKRYAAIREGILFSEDKAASISAPLSTDGHFIAVLTTLEKATCPQDVVAIFVDALRAASFERVDKWMSPTCTQLSIFSKVLQLVAVCNH